MNAILAPTPNGDAPKAVSTDTAAPGPRPCAEAGRRLLASLGVDADAAVTLNVSDDPATYRPFSRLWIHPTSDAQVFVGGDAVARGRPILDSLRIRHVVNCQEPSAPNYYERAPQAPAPPDPADPDQTERGGALAQDFQYLRFDIEGECLRVVREPGAVLSVFEPFFVFVDRALSDGHNVLIHYYAGAHRAGAAAVAFLMYVEGRCPQVALAMARERRKEINPPVKLQRLLLAQHQHLTPAPQTP